MLGALHIPNQKDIFGALFYVEFEVYSIYYLDLEYVAFGYLIREPKFINCDVFGLTAM